MLSVFFYFWVAQTLNREGHKGKTKITKRTLFINQRKFGQDGFSANPNQDFYKFFVFFGFSFVFFAV